jgi:hypothetical protein
MVTWLLPIMAQTLTANAMDRAELAARIDRTTSTAEATNTASGLVRVDYSRKHLTLGLDYIPSVVVVAAPLEDNPELTLLWTQSAGAMIGVRGKHSDAGVRAQASYGERDFRREVLVGATPVSPADMGTGTTPPTPGTGEPPPTDAQVARAASGKSRFGTVRGEAWYQHRMSRAASFSLLAGYGVSKSFGDEGAAYPTTRSADATLSLANAVSRRDTLTSALTARTSSSDLGGRAWVFGLTESYAHRFSSRSTGTAIAGASYNRDKRPGEDADWSVYPIASVAYSYSRPSRNGVLTFTLTNSFNAVIDPVSSSIDPRATFTAGATWNDRHDYALAAALDTTRSLEPKGSGALQTVSGSAVATYFIASGLSAQAGVRTAFQSYEQQDQLPPTWEAFVALAFGLDLRSGILALRTPFAAR